MNPSQLQAVHFHGYPAQAQKLAVTHIELLRRLPLAFLPLLLREVIAYDYKFPVEKKELDHQFVYLEKMPGEQLQKTMAPFTQLRTSPEVERLEWVSTPGEFSEQLSAHLWATHQIDAFRAAAVEYVSQLNAARVEEPAPVHRLGIAVIGQGSAGTQATTESLFRKLRPHGVHYRALAPSDGYEMILRAVSARAKQYPAAFGHWHIDGGPVEASTASGVTRVSYASLQPVRTVLQDRIQKGFESRIGSEALRTSLARMRPGDVGLPDSGDAAVLNRFQLSLLTEGSGTQIFSTTFVQWAAREVWRRAQPVTLLAHFTPRQREESSQELLSEARRKPVLDPEGSLVDADMGAYYTWINQQRLSGAADARFLVWFEGHGQAVAIAPGLRKGTTSSSAVELQKLIAELV